MMYLDMNANDYGKILEYIKIWLLKLSIYISVLYLDIFISNIMLLKSEKTEVFYSECNNKKYDDMY